LTFSSWANSKGLNFTDVPPGAAFFQIDEINRVVYGLNKQRMQVWKAEIPAPGGEAKSFQRMPLEIDTLVARHKYGGN
jgi:hypothetical protein